MNRLVALCGYKGCGKSTIAMELHKHGYVTMSFAAPIKAMLATMGLTEFMLGAGKEKPQAMLCGHTPRYLMQTLGTEWGREIIGKDIWVNILYTKALDHLKKHSRNRIVIDDMRFENEARVVKELDGCIVRVNRPGASVTSHASETSVDRINQDFNLDNSGDIEKTMEKLKYMLRIGMDE